MPLDVGMEAFPLWQTEASEAIFWKEACPAVLPGEAPSCRCGSDLEVETDDVEVHGREEPSLRAQGDERQAVRTALRAPADGKALDVEFKDTVWQRWLHRSEGTSIAKCQESPRLSWR